jgi:Ca2+-binding EF-hand superfamily protein
MLKKLELPIPEQAVEPLFRKLDKNSSNYIEYDEFKRFLFFDPFPV